MCDPPSMILLIAVLVLALIPQVAWLIVTYRHARESRRTALWIAALAGFVLTTLAVVSTLVLTLTMDSR
jgi:hypothetical protein